MTALQSISHDSLITTIYEPQKQYNITPIAANSAGGFEWPKPYKMAKHGLILEGENGDIQIAGRFDVMGLCRQSDGGSWGLMLAFYDPDKTLKQIEVSNAEICSERGEATASLANQGLSIKRQRALKTALSVAYDAAQSQNKRVLLVNKGGWIYEGGAFCIGDTIIQSDKETSILRQGNPEKFEVKGLLQDWQNHIAAPSIGNSRLIMALCAAFAAPLLRLIDCQGFGLHFYGGSSCGKTTALKVGNSVYGLKTGNWRATDNGLEAKASDHNDLLLCLDEIGQADSKTASETAYMLANGEGKSRANRSGGARNSLSWRVLVLSTGEITLSQAIAQSGRKTMAGQEVRLVNIAADCGAGFGVFEVLPNGTTGAVFSNQLQDAAARFSGAAGVAFIKAIQKDNGTAIKALVIETQKKLAVAFPDIEPQAGRVLSNLAICAAAGEYASNNGIVPWPKGEAIRAVKSCFAAWLGERGKGDFEVQAVLDAVRGFIELHGASRFENEGDNKQTIINRAGFIQNVNGERCFCFYSGVWKDEVLKGQNTKFANKVLIERGFLIAGEDGNASRPQRFNGNVGRAYIIKEAIINE